MAALRSWQPGVEQAWAQWCSQVFARLGAGVEGAAYRPAWCQGHFSASRMNSFASSVGGSFSSAICSVASPPGSSSGVGGVSSGGVGGSGEGGGG